MCVRRLLCSYHAMFPSYLQSLKIPNNNFSCILCIGHGPKCHVFPVWACFLMGVYFLESKSRVERRGPFASDCNEEAQFFFGHFLCLQNFLPVCFLKWQLCFFLICNTGLTLGCWKDFPWKTKQIYHERQLCVSFTFLRISKFKF